MRSAVGGPGPDQGTTPWSVSLGTGQRRMVLLAGLGCLLGGVGGLAAYLIVKLVALLSNLALLHRVGFTLPNLSHYHPGPGLLGVAVAGALVVVALARWSPVIKGHGIPESLEAILFRESRIRPRAAFAKPVSAAVAMGTGGPFGAEGPIIVTGGSVGSLVGQVLSVSPDERRLLLATGAAAGMAGVFNTPIAAVVLAFELLAFERSLRALVPLVLATGIAAALHRVLLDPRPLFALVHPVSVPPGQLWLFAVLGLPAGALAVCLNKGLFLTERGFRLLPGPERWHPVVGAIGFAVVGFIVPGTLSVGYWAISDAVNGRFLLSAAAALFAAKTVSWWVALASNTSGGTLAPMFLIGATMGDMVGIGFTHLFPGWHLVVGAFALVAMGATFGVGARAQLTGVLFAAEVTGAYSLLVPLLIATAVAELVAQGFLHDRIMTDKLFRRGYRVDLDVDQDPLRARVAGQLMDPGGADAAAGAPVVDRWSFLADCLPVFVDSGAERLAVVDRGEVVGSLSREAVVEVYRLRWSAATRQPGALARRRDDHRSGGEGNGTGDAAAGDGDGSPGGRSATGEVTAAEGGCASAPRQDRATGPPGGPGRVGGAPAPGEAREAPEDVDRSPGRGSATGRPGRGERHDDGR